MAIWCERPSVVIKLPNQRSVGVPFGPGQSQGPGPSMEKMRIRLFHSGHRRFQVRIAARLAPLGVAHLLDPILQTLRGRLEDAMRRRRPQSLNRNHLAYPVRIDSRVVQNNYAAQRMADQVNRKVVYYIRQGG